MDSENRTKKLIINALKVRYKKLQLKYGISIISNERLERVSTILSSFIEERFSEYSQILPKLHGAEDGIVLKDSNEDMYYIKMSEAPNRLRRTTDVSEQLEPRFVQMTNDSRINTQIYCSIMGEDIAIQPEVFLIDGLSLSSSKEVSKRYCNLTEYLPKPTIGLINIDKNLIIPDNLIKIFAFTICLGLKDVRGDNLVVDLSSEKPRLILVDFLNPEERAKAISINDVITRFNENKSRGHNNISWNIKIGDRTVTLFKEGNNYAKNMVDLFYLLQTTDNSGQFIASPSPLIEKSYPLKRCFNKILTNQDIGNQDIDLDLQIQITFAEIGEKMLNRYSVIKQIISNPTDSDDLNILLKEKEFLENGLITLFKVDQLSRAYFAKQTIGNELRKQIILGLKPDKKIDTLSDNEEAKILNHKPILLNFNPKNILGITQKQNRARIVRRLPLFSSGSTNSTNLPKIIRPAPSQPVVTLHVLNG